MLLARLEGVRQTGPGRWIARCPSHDDKSPSLSIRELDDGRVLVHDFAGCTFDEIIGAVGIEAHDLFPPRVAADHIKGERRPFPASDVLEAIADETFYVAFMAATMAQGHVLTAVDKALLDRSYDRIMEARRYALGR